MTIAQEAYSVDVLFPHESGLPEDTVQTGFTLIRDVGSAAFEDAETAIQGFFNDDLPSQTFSLSSRFGTQLVRTALAAQITWTQLPAEPALLGSPERSVGFTLDAAGNTINLPSEAALVLSLNADLNGFPEEATVGGELTRPRARRRGRLYLGPFNNSVQSSSGVSRPLLAVRQGIADQAAALGSALALADWSWAIWSRTNWEVHPVIGAHVDNSWDTIRKRGEQNTARSVVVVPN